MSRERVDLSVLPIDVGFDCRRHGIRVDVPESTTSAAYDIDGKEHLVRGTADEVVAALQAAGYRARVATVTSTLPLRWLRVERGWWGAGPYELRRRASGSWRILKAGVPCQEASTLPVGKALCAADYIDPS